MWQIEIADVEIIMKSIVVFYSLTGKTKMVAEVISEATRADLIEIKETKPRKPSAFIYLTGGFAAITNKLSEINPTTLEATHYDKIFIGSPVWAMRPVPAINSFIAANDFEGREVIPFFTMGGERYEKTLMNIEAKIVRRHGRIDGHFAIKTHRCTDDDIRTKALEVVQKYIG